ncbi:MAG: NifU family protein [bacterium]
MKEKVEFVLDKIRKALKMDGGDIELVDVLDDVVMVRLKGACAGCPFSQMTIKNFVERELKKAIPEVKKVEAVPLEEEFEEEFIEEE